MHIRTVLAVTSCKEGHRDTLGAVRSHFSRDADWSSEHVSRLNPSTPGDGRLLSAVGRRPYNTYKISTMRSQQSSLPSEQQLQKPGGGGGGGGGGGRRSCEQRVALRGESGLTT